MTLVVELKDIYGAEVSEGKLMMLANREKWSLILLMFH